MYTAALTGPIGSGKTTVSEVFEALGIPVYSTDSNARRLMCGPVRGDVERILGAGAFLADGSLDRPQIRRMIFSDVSLRRRLNAAVHPAVRDDFTLWAASARSPYALVETALLVEGGLLDTVDAVIVVDADSQTLAQRTMQRDSLTRETAESRIRSQRTAGEIVSLVSGLSPDKPCFRITNDGRTLVIPRILEIDKILLSLSVKKRNI